MYSATPNKVVYVVCGFIFAVPAIFFLYYTARLIYVNIVMSAEEAAAHRTGGMLIGAVTFPLVAIICGLLSWRFIKKAFEK